MHNPHCPCNPGESHKWKNSGNQSYRAIQLNIQTHHHINQLQTDDDTIKHVPPPGGHSEIVVSIYIPAHNDLYGEKCKKYIIKNGKSWRAYEYLLRGHVI